MPMIYARARPHIIRAGWCGAASPPPEEAIVSGGCEHSLRHRCRRELERPVTTDQVLLGVGLILVLAVGSQVLASRLKIPALIILLPVGFTAGAITTDVNPQDLLGAAFQPLVSLAVAVILYDSGMSLNLRKLRGHTRRIVVGLIVMGVPVTLAFAAVFSGLLLNMSLQAAVMLGAILVVSGPTVVLPLLGFIRPTERLQHVLSWEGSLIDAVGGILGAVVFHAVIASSRHGPAYQVAQFLSGIGAGLVGGVVGTAVLWFLLRKLRLTRFEVGQRYAGGARIRTLSADGGRTPADADGSLLFLVRADGRLAPVTRTGPPEPEAGDTMVLLGPCGS